MVMILKLMNLILLSTFLYSMFTMFVAMHPLILGVMVIIQCLVTAATLSEWHKFSYFSFFILIIYLGGILMLFSYIISLNFSKEPVAINKKSFKYTMNASLMYSLTNYKFSYSKTFYNDFFNDFSMDTIKFNLEDVLQSMFTSSMKMSTFLLILLLISMMMVVYITESSKGNMRSM